MDRKALALALITSTSAIAACASGTDDTAPASGSADLTSFHTIGAESACVSVAPGRQGEFRGRNVRVQFSKGAAGPIAVVESYDAGTGLLSQKPAEYQYKRVSDTEIELFYIDSGDRFVPYTLKVSGDNVQVSVPTYLDPSPITLKCDLANGAPSAALPVAQAVAAPQKITGAFPLPPALNVGGTCIGSKLVDGNVVQLMFRRDGKLGDDNMYAHFLVYNGKTHLLAKDLLAGTDAVFTDGESSFSIASDGTSYADIEMKTVDGAQTLVLVPKSSAVKEGTGAELPLNCDFVGH